MRNELLAEKHGGTHHRKVRIENDEVMRAFAELAARKLGIPLGFRCEVWVDVDANGVPYAEVLVLQ